MSVSNLTGTKWLLNSSLGQRMPSGTYFDDSGDGDVTEYYDINFISNNQTFNLLVFNDTETVALGVRTANLQYGTTDVWMYQNSVWSNEAYRTISITGGNDVTNANLISWLEAHATQIAATYKTFDLSTLQLSLGAHTVQVKARATGYKDSNFSNSVIYNTALLKTPQIALFEDRYLLVDEVPNGQYYDVYMNNTLKKTLGGDVDIYIYEMSTSYKDYLRIYDGQDNTGTLLYESSSSTTDVSLKLNCSTGYLCIKTKCNNSSDYMYYTNQLLTKDISIYNESAIGREITCIYKVDNNGSIFVDLDYKD